MIPQAQHGVAVLTSVLASQARLWRGAASFRPVTQQPLQTLELYEFEASPYCRLVREVLTELDLDVMIYPCPKGGQRFRPHMNQLGGKQQFPFLVDPNTGRRLYESLEIVDYLVDTYGRRARMAKGPVSRPAAVTTATLSSVIRALPRVHQGMKGVRGLNARPSQAPAQALELYSFEASPYSRLVREVLCELELPYLLRQFGKACWEDMGPPQVRQWFFKDTPIVGRNRLRLRELTGRSQVPYLLDPNTGTAMFESAAIIDYLERTYGRA